MFKPDAPVKDHPSIWAVALLLVSSAFAVASAILLSGAFVPV